MPKQIKFEPKQEEFLKIYGDSQNYLSIRKSCKQANIGKSTFYRWLKEPKLKERVEKIREKRNSDPLRQIKKGNILASMKFLENAYASFEKGDYVTVDRLLEMHDKSMRIFDKRGKKC